MGATSNSWEILSNVLTGNSLSVVNVTNEYKAFNAVYDASLPALRVTIGNLQSTVDAAVLSALTTFTAYSGDTYNIFNSYSSITNNNTYEICSTFCPQTGQTIEELFKSYQTTTTCPSIWQATGVAFSYADYDPNGIGPFTGSDIVIITTDKKLQMDLQTNPASDYRTQVNGMAWAVYDNPNFVSHFLINALGYQWTVWNGIYDFIDNTPHLVFLSGGMETLTAITIDRFTTDRSTLKFQNQYAIRELRIPFACTGLTSIVIKNEELSQDSVNQILINADLNGQFNGKIDLKDTNLRIFECICTHIPSNSKPSGNGCIAVRNLKSKGWEIKTN